MNREPMDTAEHHVPFCRDLAHVWAFREHSVFSSPLHLTTYPGRDTSSVECHGHDEYYVPVGTRAR